MSLRKPYRIANAITATRYAVALRLLPHLPERKQGAPMTPFEFYFEKTRLRCMIVIAEKDRDAVMQRLRALHTQRHVDGVDDTPNARQLALHHATIAYEKHRTAVTELRYKLKKLQQSRAALAAA